MNTGALLKLSQSARALLLQLSTGARELAFVDQKRSSFHNLASVSLSLPLLISSPLSSWWLLEAIDELWMNARDIRDGLERSVENLSRVVLSRAKDLCRAFQQLEEFRKRFARHRFRGATPFLVAVDGYAGVHKFAAVDEKAQGSSVSRGSEHCREYHVRIFHPPFDKCARRRERDKSRC